MASVILSLTYSTGSAEWILRPVLAVFQVTAGAMTDILKKLESKGLVKIEPNELSGRKKKITITDKGEELCEQEIAEKFPQKNIQQQASELRKVREYLDERHYR